MNKAIKEITHKAITDEHNKVIKGSAESKNTIIKQQTGGRIHASTNKWIAEQKNNIFNESNNQGTQ